MDTSASLDISYEEWKYDDLIHTISSVATTIALITSSWVLSHYTGTLWASSVVQ